MRHQSVCVKSHKIVTLRRHRKLREEQPWFKQSHIFVPVPKLKEQHVSLILIFFFFFLLARWEFYSFTSS